MNITPPCCATCQHSFMSLGLLSSEGIIKENTLYCSPLCSNMCSDNKTHLRNVKRYEHFLLYRVFDRIDFPSNEAFLASIKAANVIHDSGQWREAKRAFNRIGERCDFRVLEHAAYELPLCGIPAFINIETIAYLSAIKKT